MEGLKIVSVYASSNGEIQFTGKLPPTAKSMAWVASCWGIDMAFVVAEAPGVKIVDKPEPAPEVELPAGATVHSPEAAAVTTVADVEEKPKRGRRKKAAEAPAEEKPKRGRRAKAAPEPAPVSEQTSGITNAELAKAMSQAASKVGSEEALAVLKEFGVQRVNELPDEERESFLQTLRILCDDA